jgi:hypothetical protein
MMSEVLVLPESAGWGGPYSDAQTALGGQVFTGWQTPNVLAADALCRRGEWLGNVEAGFREQGIPIPIQEISVAAPTVEGQPWPLGTFESAGHKQQFVTARSHHVGGVNTSKCDGSVAFVQDSVDPLLWQALSTAAGEETVTGG